MNKNEYDGNEGGFLVLPIVITIMLLFFYCLPILRKFLIKTKPELVYLFRNDMRNAYIKQKYAFTKLSVVRGTLKRCFVLTNRRIYFNFDIYLSNTSEYECLAPTVQYSFFVKKDNKLINIHNGYHRLRKIIPSSCSYHKISEAVLDHLVITPDINFTEKDLVCYFRLLPRYG